MAWSTRGSWHRSIAARRCATWHRGPTRQRSRLSSASPRKCSTARSDGCRPLLRNSRKTTPSMKALPSARRGLPHRYCLSLCTDRTVDVLNYVGGRRVTGLNLVCQCARLCAVTIALLFEGMFQPVWLEKGGSGTLACICQSKLVIIINRVACGHYETVVLTCLILP